MILPQGLTLIQRPGQIVKTIQQQTQQPQQIQLQPQTAQPTQVRIQQQPQIVQMQQVNTTFELKSEQFIDSKCNFSNFFLGFF